METVVRFFLLWLLCLGVGTDVTLAIVCQYSTDNVIHRKYCSERCCDYDERSGGSNICCRYTDKDGIYLGTIGSVVIIALAIIICMCRICFRRKVRGRSSTSYGSSDERPPAFQSPWQQNRVHPNNLTSDGEPVQLEIQMPPAYVTHPPPYSKSDPAKCGFKNEVTPLTEPPPAYSAVDQSRTGT